MDQVPEGIRKGESRMAVMHSLMIVKGSRIGMSRSRAPCPTQGSDARYKNHGMASIP